MKSGKNEKFKVKWQLLIDNTWKTTMVTFWEKDLRIRSIKRITENIILHKELNLNIVEAENMVVLTDVNGNSMMIFKNIMLNHVSAVSFKFNGWQSRDIYLERIYLEEFIQFVILYFRQTELLHTELSKEFKLETLAKKSILLCVEELMKTLPYEYYLLKYDHKMVLGIKMKGRFALEIQLYHRNFHTTLPKIPTMIKIFEELQTCSLNFNVKRYDNNQKWNRQIHHL